MDGYLDAATCVPLHPVARQAMLAALEDGWADPGKLYAAGRKAGQLLDAARGAAAQCLAVRDDELHFTSSGTEAARLAVIGTRAARYRAGDAVVHSAVEHSSVLKACAGGRAVSVAVSRTGRVDLGEFAAAVRAPGVALAALMSANHEVGTVQPVAAAADICAAADVPLYCDAAQTVGRAGVVHGWALLSASARKWGGPSGVGLLVVRKGTRWSDPRSAAPAVNLPAIVGAVASLRAALGEAQTEALRLAGLVDRIRAEVAAWVPDVEMHGDPIERLPHIAAFSCLYVDAEALLHALDREGFAVSSGSACTADTLHPSHVLVAMGVLSQGNVRVSLHRGTTEADVSRFLQVLPGVVADLRARAGVHGL